MFSRENSKLQMIDTTHVNTRKQAFTNQYPVGDDVSQRTSDAVGSAVLMTAGGRRKDRVRIVTDSGLPHDRDLVTFAGALVTVQPHAHRSGEALRRRDGDRQRSAQRVVDRIECTYCTIRLTLPELVTW